jgi:hypothetical protein
MACRVVAGPGIVTAAAGRFDMDPNLFHLDWERTFEALVGMVVLSLLVERALSLLFESRWWIARFEDPRIGKPDAAKLPPPEPQPAAKRVPLKEFLAFVLSLVVCLSWDFDAVSIIFLTRQTSTLGIVVTAAIVAGGSKSSVALFQDVMKVMSSAQRERRRLKGDTV